MTTTPVFGITGWKNSGKTQLVASLVAEFTARGLKVSTVKHAHHASISTSRARTVSGTAKQVQWKLHWCLDAVGP